jgi:hypothetical protein
MQDNTQSAVRLDQENGMVLTLVFPPSQNIITFSYVAKGAIFWDLREYFGAERIHLIQLHSPSFKN